MPHASEGKRDLRERLREELVKYLALSAYLYVCFAAIALYKWAVLREAGVAFLPLGLAAIKALIVGKFLLLGNIVSGGLRLDARGLLERVFARTFVLLVLLFVLVLVEELAVGLFHGRTAGAVLAEFRAYWPEHAALSFLIALILLPLVAAIEFARARGTGLVDIVREQLRAAKAPAYPGEHV